MRPDVHPRSRLPSSPRSTSPLLALAALLAACSGGGGGGAPPPPPPGSCPVVDKLAVVSSTPVPWQEGVSTQAKVEVQFNTCLDLASATAASVTLYRTFGTAVPGAVQLDASRTTLVFTPSAPLAYAATYHFSVTTALRGSRGEQLATPHLFSFDTRSTPETVPPVTTASPPAGRYREPQTVSLDCVDNVGGTGCAITRYTLDGSTPTAASPRYTAPILVDRDLTLRFFSTDVDGNAEAPRSAEYVIDADPPGVAWTDPPDGATGVRVDAVIRVGFDEAMSEASLLEQPAIAPATQTGPPSDGSEPTEIARVPLAPLDCATTYQITVGTAATDVAGNPLPAPHVFTFTTTADCEEPTTTASLASGVYTAEQQVTLSCDDGAGGSGCARIAYTLDGSAPTFSPPNGTIVAGASVGPIPIGLGETTLRFRAQDAAGHAEVIRERRYSVSDSGFTWLAAGDGLARGVGPIPERFVPIQSMGRTSDVSRDLVTGRLYRVTERGLVFSDDDGATFERLPVVVEGALVRPAAVAAAGSRIYVGADDGLFRSADGGATFAQVLDGSVRCVIAVGQDVWVGTATGLVYSNDRLRTLRSGLASPVRDIAVSGDRVYVAYANQVGVSLDRGATWSHHQPPGASAVNAIAIAGTTAFAGTDVGLAVSVDGGPFDVIRSTGAGLDANPVEHVGADGDRVYVATKEPSSTAPSAFFVSTDGGVTFTRRHIPGGTRDTSVYAIRVEGSTVHVGGYPTYWRSVDRGTSFALADLNGDDVRRVVAVGAKVYAAIHDSSGFGGLVISSDRGRTFRWLGVEHGLPDGGVDDLFVDGGALYAATWRGLAVTRDDGATFDVRTQANSGLWQSSAGTVWASGSTVWAGAVSKLQLSTDGGKTFVDRLTSVTPVAVRATGTGAGASVYLAASDGVWVSSSGGGSFVRRTTADGLAEDYLRAMDLGPDGALWASTSAALDVSRDGGATFQRVSLPPGIYPSFVRAGPDALYLGASGALAVSTDGGQSFVVLPTGRWYLKDVARTLP